MRILIRHIKKLVQNEEKPVTVKKDKALATEYNPGSTPSGNIPFLLSLACIKQRMLPEEAINVVTINGAAAMELSDQLGSIAKGKKANIFITKPVPSLEFIPYAFGSELVETVILNGEVI